MLLLIHVLLTVGLTALYLVPRGLTWSFGTVLTVILTLIVSFILILIAILAFYVPYIYLSENRNKTGKVKHFLFNLLARYVFVDMFRVKIIVSGKENLPKNNRFVIYMNHIEYTDPIYVKMVFRKYPIAYVAKEPLFKTFLVKNLLRGVNCVSITKDADRSAMQSIIESIRIVKSGQPMGIFPEGRRTYSNNLTDFKPGSFKLAMKASADISPVVLYNMHGILKKGRILPHKAYIHICPLIPYEEYKDLDSITLSEKVKTIINDKLDDFKSRIPES